MSTEAVALQAEVLRVRGYHGTSRQAAEAILRQGFWISRRDWDWLGDGAYFFQDAPLRALEWATARDYANPTVVGAVIRLDYCMDLLDIGWYEAIAELYEQYAERLRQRRIPLPVQSSGAHRLDRAVLNFAVASLRGQGTEIKAIRAAYAEGRPAFPESALYDRAHVQIAVRDLSLIEGAWIVGGGEDNR